MDQNQTLQVTILSQQQILFQGSVFSVSSKNYAGEFDILPEHARFITFIENQPITLVKLNHQKLIFNFIMGIIYVNNNVVKIYTKPEIPTIV